ncbi:MAG: OadG family protein, partial [Candidatus Cloacimonadaceae bacterium]|nr:OadG family protein [Candidatus Cloacimonadaceae bacterium]
MKKYSLLIIILAMWAFSFAQPAADERFMMIGNEMVVYDSLTFEREKDIASVYGFKDTDLLREVAAKLKIEDFDVWKGYLNLEVQNRQLDEKTLRQLGISPYQALLAHQSAVFGINELNTILEVATKLDMPVKKLKEMLHQNPLDRSVDHTSLQVTGVTPEEVILIKNDFDKNMIAYGGSITFVGMLVVFSSLALSSVIISQLIHLNRTRKPKAQKIVLEKDGRIRSLPKDANRSMVVAAITALHVHVQSIEERRRLLLTFKRAPINLWRTTNVLN